MSMATGHEKIEQGREMVEEAFAAMQQIALVQNGSRRNLTSIDDLRGALANMNACLHDMAHIGLPNVRGISPMDLADTSNELMTMLHQENADIDAQQRFNRLYGDFAMDVGTYCRGYREMHEDGY